MKRVLSILLTGVIVAGSTISFASSNSKSEVLNSKPFIHGYLNKTFAPEKNITRAEAVKMAVEALEYKKTKEGIDKFKDMADGSHWASEYIGAAVKEGIINGKLDGNFHPDENITRAELMTVISKSVKDGNAVNKKVRGFTDLEESHWAFSFIIRGAKFGYISGYTDGSLKADNDIERAEATKLINRRLDRDAAKIDTSDLVNKFTDMDKKNWAYNDVLLGSNDFDYKIEKGKFVIVKSNEAKPETEKKSSSTDKAKK